MAIGEAGATNAALFALRLLSVEDQAIATALADFAEDEGQRGLRLSLLLHQWPLLPQARHPASER